MVEDSNNDNAGFYSSLKDEALYQNTGIYLLLFTFYFLLFTFYLSPKGFGKPMLRQGY